MEGGLLPNTPEPEVSGAAAEVIADFDEEVVIVRFTDPVTSDTVLEVHLGPDTARDLAFHLTRASIAVEEDDRS